MDDLISRKRTSAWLENMGYSYPAKMIMDEKRFPSAQPEIIYCKDCKHFVREDIEEYTPYGYNTHFHAFCDKHWDGEQGEYIDVNLDDFCSFAERREVTI